MFLGGSGQIVGLLIRLLPLSPVCQETRHWTVIRGLEHRGMDFFREVLHGYDIAPRCSSKTTMSTQIAGGTPAD